MARRALLIATDTYRDSRLGMLQAPVREAQQLRDLLADPDVGFFNPVHLLQNESKPEIERGMERLFRDAGPGDTVLLYLSGHGIIDAAGQLYFAVGNTEFDLPMSTAIPAVHIHRLVEMCDADAKLILLDCCYSGAIVLERTARGGEVVDLRGELLAGRGTYFLAASNAVQPAFEQRASHNPDEPAQSLFTTAVLAGLATGAADLEHDGRITPDELYRFVHRHVRQRSARQNPVADGSVEGEVYIAWARSGVRRPSTAGDALILGDLLPGLTTSETAGLRADGWWGTGRLAVPLGRAYRPGEADGDPVWLDFATGSGHLLVVGRLGSGKSVLLSTLVTGLALTHGPEEIALYGVEAASNRLGSLRALPHLREVAGDDEPNRVAGILSTVETLTRSRQKLFRERGIGSLAGYRAWRAAGNQPGDHADVFLLVDGWQVFGRSEKFTERVRELASAGPAYGVHVVVTSRWWDAVPADLAYLLQSHIELRLDEPATSRIDPDTARALPDDKPGWALHLGRRFQIAVPRIDRELTVDVAPDGSADLVDRLVAALPRPVTPAASAATGAEPRQGTTPSPQAYDLASVLELGDPARFDPSPEWARRGADDRLRVPIGLDPSGGRVWLDLKEAAQGGMGPHGLVVGASGSGKSELLRSLVLALAASHSPAVVNFLLVGFGGGSGFTTLDRLPHTSALITNLGDDPALVGRLGEAIGGELVRRQELLRQAGNYASHRDYEKARAAGAALEPMPSLLIVCDEFAELLAAHPDFLEVFVQIGRLGRSLGVHLLLATQRLDEGRLRGLDSHLSYRIGLRTFSAVESRAVLGVPDAYELPRQPGHGYLRFGAEPPVRFKDAYASGPAGVATDAIGGTLSDILVSRLESAAPRARPIWLPPLDEPPALDQLLPPLASDPLRGLTVTDPQLRGALQAVGGIVDRPFEQRQDSLWLNLAGATGHVAVAGRPQSGKSNLLRTVIASLALTHTPWEAQFYCLDFGGGALAELRDLPHVGGVASRLDVNAVRRTVAQVTTLIAERERHFAEHGIDGITTYRRLRAEGQYPGDPYRDVFLVVDGWATLRQEFEDLESPLAAIALNGLTYGVHLLVTVARWSELRPAIQDLFGTRLELRLGDPAESMVDRRTARNVPPDSPGRGLTADGLHFLAGVPRIDGRRTADDVADGLAKLVRAVADAWSGGVAPPVRLLPTVLPYEQLPVLPAGPGIPVGIAEHDLGKVLLDFDTEPHLVLFGDVETGKSTFLRVLAKGIAEHHSPEQARILLIDYRRSVLGGVSEKHLLGYGTSAQVAADLVDQVVAALRKRIPGPDVTADQLRHRSWWSGPEVYLLVDDYDLVASPSGNPLQPLLEFIPIARDVGLHVVITRRTGGAGRALYDPVISRIRELGAPAILMSGDRSEGVLWGNLRPQPLPPGRGWLVTRREGARLIQLAWLPPEA